MSIEVITGYDADCRSRARVDHNIVAGLGDGADGEAGPIGGVVPVAAAGDPGGGGWCQAVLKGFQARPEVPKARWRAAVLPLVGILERLGELTQKSSKPGSGHERLLHGSGKNTCTARKGVQR